MLFFPGFGHRFLQSGRTYLQKFGKPVFIILALTAALAILIVDGNRLLTYTFRLKPELIFLSIGISLVGLVFFAVPVWHLILRRFGSRLSFRDNLRIYCYSVLGIAIPGGIWPLIGRVTLYEREGVSGLYVTVATVIELILLGLAGLALYSFSTLFITADTIWQKPQITIVTTLFFLVLMQPPIFNRIINAVFQRFGRSNQTLIKLQYKDILLWLLLEIITVFIGGTAIYTLLRSLVVVSTNFYITIISAWAAGIATSSLFFWFPGKPLVRDGIIALILMQAVSPSLAIIFTLIIRLWNTISIIIIAGLAWLLLRNSSPAQITKHI